MLSGSGSPCSIVVLVRTIYCTFFQVVIAFYATTFLGVYWLVKRRKNKKAAALKQA